MTGLHVPAELLRHHRTGRKLPLSHNRHSVMIEARQGMRKYPELRRLETGTIPRVPWRNVEP
jgi:hypothetical protein